MRTIDISKKDTRFCNVGRVEPEANKIFRQLRADNWLEGVSRSELVQKIAEYYGDLNMIHPFREGNGRTQRMLFEQIIINAGYQIDWSQVEEAEWLQANIDAVICDYRALVAVFERCVGGALAE